jgi:site-specific recombinase XerD
MPLKDKSIVLRILGLKLFTYNILRHSFAMELLLSGAFGLTYNFR